MIETKNFSRNIEASKSRLDVIEKNTNIFSIFNQHDLPILRNIVSGKGKLITVILILTFVVGIVEGLRAVAVIALIKTLTASVAELSTFANYSAFGFQFNFLEKYSTRYDMIEMVAYVILATTIIISILKYIVSLTSVNLRQIILRKIRVSVLKKIFSFPLDFYTHARSGELIFLITSEASRVTSAIYNVKDLIAHLITGTVFFSILVYLNWKMSILLIIFSIVFFLLNLIVEKRIKISSLIANDLVNSSSHVIHQILNGIKMIKIGNLENKELKDFSKLHKQYDTHEIIVGKLRAFSGVIQEVFFILLLFSSVFLVRYVYPSDGLVEVGSDILAYLFMLLRFVPSARGVISSRGAIISAYGPLSRIVAILKRENGGDWLQNQETDKLKTEINTLRLNKVSFNYSDDEDMSSLNGVTYEFKQGKRYAIVGPSGSGKSTLLDLCAGIIQPKDGQIFINQDKIDNTRKLRDPQVVSYVNQEPVIFHTNMRDNISFYNRDASESEIEEAVSYAQLENLISANKDGLDMLVGERGQALSGGEKQRIGLARSFLQKSFVMLIDEGTNALDYITEKNVYDSIQKVGSDKIVIVVAHRITAIKDFDEILVLKDGCIVESGTHHQLMSLEGEYVKLIHSHNDVT